MTNSITTYHFPTTYENGNWILFNIYVHENTRFHEGSRAEWNSNEDWLFSVGVDNADKTTLGNVTRGLRYEPRPIRTGNRAQRTTKWALDAASEVRTQKIDTSIGLYLPENISFSYGVDWGAGEEMGLVRSMANAAGAIGKGVEQFSQTPGWESFKGITNAIKNSASGSDVVGLGVRMMASMASIVGIPFDKLYDKHQKNVINRHTELHFNGVNLRSFQFNFKFYPRNVDEANHIRAITDAFKFHMHPELSNNTTGLYMMYPAEFEISFMRGWEGAGSSRNWNVAKIGRAALTECSISHGESEYVPIRGPNWSPSNPNDYYNSFTEMKLTFQELTVLTKTDILEGK